MDTNFHRADTEQVILIVHEGAEPAGAAQEEAALADCFSTQRDLNAEKVIAALDRIIPEAD